MDCKTYYNVQDRDEEKPGVILRLDTKNGIYMSWFPGCCGIVIAHDAWFENWPNMERFRDVMPCALKYAKEKRFGLLIYTHYHESFINAAKELGFEVVREFKNPKTLHIVREMHYIIKYGEEA